jgi:hypothetical protein
MIPEEPNEEQALAAVYAEMERTWPNPCRVCGLSPEFLINGVFSRMMFHPNIVEWTVRCPNRLDDDHRAQSSGGYPHTVFCRDKDGARKAWNRAHPIHLILATV